VTAQPNILEIQCKHFNQKMREAQDKIPKYNGI